MPLIVRVSIGRFCISVASMVLATFDCVTSISGASPVTVSVSARPASASLKSTVSVALTSSLTFSRVAGCEAGQLGLDLVYVPVSSPGMEYDPPRWSPWSAPRPVLTLVAVTVTPGSTASPWSRIRPLNVLVACCPYASGAAISKQNVMNDTRGIQPSSAPNCAYHLLVSKDSSQNELSARGARRIETKSRVCNTQAGGESRNGRPSGAANASGIG